MALTVNDVAIPEDCVDCAELLDEHFESWVLSAPSVGVNTDTQIKALLENHLRLYHAAEHVGGE